MGIFPIYNNWMLNIARYSLYNEGTYVRTLEQVFTPIGIL